jgi:cytoskeleton-associated protein 5
MCDMSAFQNSMDRRFSGEAEAEPEPQNEPAQNSPHSTPVPLSERRARREAAEKAKQQAPPTKTTTAAIAMASPMASPMAAAMAAPAIASPRMFTASPALPAQTAAPASPAIGGGGFNVPEFAEGEAPAPTSPANAMASPALPAQTAAPASPVIGGGGFNVSEFAEGEAPAPTSPAMPGLSSSPPATASGGFGGVSNSPPASSAAFTVSEFAAGAAPAAPAFEGPLADRLVHKNWKARQLAYQELQALFEAQADPVATAFQEHRPLFKKMLSDSNASALGSAIGAVVVFVDKAAGAADITEDVAGVIVDKCMMQKKAEAGTHRLVLLLLEVGEAGATGLVEQLVRGTLHKSPKIQLPCLQLLTKAVVAFGVGAIAVKAVAQALPPVFASAKDKKCREEAVACATELYRRMGDKLMPLLDQLRPVQRKELEARFEELPTGDMRPAPTTLLRCAAARAGPGGAAPSGGGAGGGQAAEAEDLFGTGPVDLLKELNVKYFVKAMDEAKWKLRCDAIEKVVSIAAPAASLAAGDYGEVVSLLKRALADANMAVVAAAIKALGLLGKGLGDDFRAHALSLVPALFERIVSKNRGVVAAVGSALDNLHRRCFELGDAKVLEAVSETMTAKNADGREKACAWVERVVLASDASFLAKPLPALSAMLLKAVDDSTPAVREAAARALGALLHVAGEAAMAGALADNRLDKHKLKKVRSTAAVLGGGGAAEAPAKPTAKRKLKGTSSRDKPDATKPPAAAEAKAEPAAAAEAGSLSDEEFTAKCAALFPAAITDQLASKNFKARIEGIAALEQLLFGDDASERNLDVAFGEPSDTELAVRFLKARLTGLKDSNVMATVAAFKLVTRLAGSS